jgi:hypothetical protein
MYKKPSSSLERVSIKVKHGWWLEGLITLCSSYIELMRAAVGGKTSSTKIKMAFSGDSLMRFLIT